MFLLEQWRAACLGQPLRGAFIESWADRRRYAVDPDDPDALSTDAACGQTRLRERLALVGFGACASTTRVAHSVDRLIAVYESLTSGAP